MRMDLEMKNTSNSDYTHCMIVVSLEMSEALATRYFENTGRKAIAIDPCYISKVGKKTPHIDNFWSGGAQAVKHGLEIMEIALIDIDAHDCIMLRAHQTPSFKELNLRSKSMWNITPCIHLNQ